MGISTTTNRVSYVGDGVTQAFSFPYYFTKAADLLVYKYYAPVTMPVTPPVITPFVLGTDYTISGTLNGGLYSGGGTVNTTVIPDTDTQIVITRDPVEQQNFALLYGGIIPSAPLVNQLDYLTILVQRLRDLASRTVSLDDGDVESGFDLALPPGISGQDSVLLGTNPAGNGWQLFDSAAFAGPAGPTGPAGPAGASGIVINALSATATLVVGSPVNQQHIPCDATAASFTVNFPVANSAAIGQVFTVKKIDAGANTVTLAANGSDKFLALSLVSTLVLDYQGKSLSFVCRAVGVWDLI